MIKYRFYPTIIEDSYKLLHWQDEAAKPWNRDRSPEHVYGELRQSLLNHINRIPFSTEAIDKGTAFNAIIDCIINNEPPSIKAPYTIHTDRENGLIRVHFPATDIAEERNFAFDKNWCIESAQYFKGALSQVFVKAELETSYGTVELYGVIDELLDDVVYDIKATGSYRLGKYMNGWQRHLYPYCLVKSGLKENIRTFEYTAFRLQEISGRISGIRCPERYRFNYEESASLLREQCEFLIEFIEENRDSITDKKIFNEQINQQSPSIR